jgi:hypothetical protein
LLVFETGFLRPAMAEKTQLAESARLEKAIRKNLKSLGLPT